MTICKFTSSMITNWILEAGLNMPSDKLTWMPHGSKFLGMPDER